MTQDKAQGLVIKLDDDKKGIVWNSDTVQAHALQNRGSRITFHQLPDYLYKKFRVKPGQTVSGLFSNGGDDASVSKVHIDGYGFFDLSDFLDCSVSVVDNVVISHDHPVNQSTSGDSTVFAAAE